MLRRWIFLLIFLSLVSISPNVALFAFLSDVPDIVFTLQQLSYFTDKDSSLGGFTCDITKPDCKGNFDLSPSFTGSFSSSDFTCLLDFGLAVPTGEEAKCNPSTVIFTGSSDYTVRFRIIQKIDPSIFSERILIIHSGRPMSDTSTGTLTNSGVLADTGVLDNSGILSETGFLVSTGNISLTTDKSAVLSGVIFEPTSLTGIVYYGTGELVSTDQISLSMFAFSGLLSDRIIYT